MLELSLKRHPNIIATSPKVTLLDTLFNVMLNPLCNGKLVNAWGLGGLCKAHSNPGAHLSLSIRK